VQQTSGRLYEDDDECGEGSGQIPTSSSDAITSIIIFVLICTIEGDTIFSATKNKFLKSNFVHLHHFDHPLSD